ERIRSVFHGQKIILSEKNSWARAGEIFLTADEEDVPGAALVHSSVRHLVLWHKIGVAERPTADLAIGWLRSLPSGQTSSQDEARRVRSLLSRHAARIWDECEHWLNLEGEWVPVSDLAYSLTMRSLIPWKHLFSAIKERTADCQMLSTEICERPPFSGLADLSNSVEDRFADELTELPVPQRKPWLSALGRVLGRIVLDDEEGTKRIRWLADRLAGTAWQVVSDLETVPYVAGAPAGAPRRCDALWKDSLLYVADRSAAKTAKAVSLELGR